MIALNNTHFFVDFNTLAWIAENLPDSLPLNEDEPNSLINSGEQCEVDVTDQLFHVKYACDGDETSIKVFLRSETGVYSEPDLDITIYDNGESPKVSKRERFQGDIQELSAVLVHFITRLRKYIVGHGLSERFENLKSESDGVLIERDEEELSLTIITGKQRPALKCITLFNGQQWVRPYIDEKAESFFDTMFGGLFDDDDEIDESEDEDEDTYTTPITDVRKDSEIIELEEKAESGDSNAQAKLAAKLMGLGNSSGYMESEVLYKDSLKWANRAAEKNEAEAYCVLALAYQHGRGVDIDHEKSAEYYRLSADGGYALAQLNLGNYLHEKQEYTEAVKWFRLAADQGNAAAMYNLGRCYQFEQGVEYDIKTAIEWYERYLELVDNPEIAGKVAALKMLPDLGDK